MADLNTLNGSRRFAAVSPSDTVDFTEIPRALYVGVTGDVVCVGSDRVAITFKAVPVGILPVQPVRVNNSSTTATNILALY